MTRDEIEKLSDEELNVMVATEVMGWELNPHKTHWIDSIRPDIRWVGFGDFKPASDIAAAWEVVEKFTHYRIETMFTEHSSGRGIIMCWLLDIHGSGSGVQAIADTAPRAISIASVLAKTQP